MSDGKDGNIYDQKPKQIVIDFLVILILCNCNLY